MKTQILVINPGSTSTKIAVYEAALEDLHEIFSTTIRHTAKELAPYPRVFQQYEFRKETILNELTANKLHLQNFAAVIGRGGLVKPIPSGTYTVNDLMIKHLSEGYGGEHASNLGGLLAHSIASQIPDCQAFIADPVVVDELLDVARITGFSEIQRSSILHALNQKAIAKRYAADCGTPYNQLNLIVVHLGGGISVGAHCKGRIIDVNDALQGEGPIAPERAGSIPALSLAHLCFSGKYTFEEIRKKIAGQGGMVALSGTNSFLELCARIQAEAQADAQAQATTPATPASNTTTTPATPTTSTASATAPSASATPSALSATAVFNAMAYTVAKEIGAMAAVLHGHIDAILFTGGIAHSKPFVDQITKQIGFLAPCHTYPGEDEMLALATNALNILTGKETPREYL
ncbi:MAG: butyrate kinase [Bacteroidales bacterium]|mgnify:CR=1 FL=1|jgi:butyrate kinase|nr:butyrate kinase [Bacteroidales bacterium]NLK80095.1 butyrate kinase [Bacteroidales bacterium]